MSLAGAPGVVAIRLALLATADTRGLGPLALALDARGVVMAARRDCFIGIFGEVGLETRILTELVPSILDGRLDTLYPELHAGVAAKDDAERAALADEGIHTFDLVVASPRPFALTASRPDVGLAMAVADIDAGAIALIREAAKNHARVVVVVDPDDYPALLDELDAAGGVSAPTRARLAAKAFAVTAAHDAAIASYLADVPDAAVHEPEREARRARLPALIAARVGRSALATAGGALYAEPPPDHGIVLDRRPTLVTARRVAGRAAPLPVRVVQDLDRALAVLRELGGPAAVIVRDDEPVAAADTGDPLGALHHVLAFADEAEGLSGASLALDGPLTAPLAARIGAADLAAILAPAVADDVAAAWPADGPALLVAEGDWDDEPRGPTGLGPLAWRSIAGGLLVEVADVAPLDGTGGVVVTARAPTATELRDLELAARIARHARAHALVVARAGGTDAIVGGQPDLRRALLVARAHLDVVLEGCVAAVSARIDDPLEVEALAMAGIRALWQPGGSADDEHVIAAADRHHLAMVVSGLEHLRR